MNLKRLISSFVHAWRGLRYAWREQNFRIMVLAALVVLALVIILPVTAKETVILILTIVIVLVLELVNTIFEHLADLAQPRIHHHVRVIKDVMAAALALASLGAFVIGILILGPYIL